MTVTTGSFITQEQVDDRSTVAVIGVGIADDLFNTRDNLLGNKIRIDDMVYTVIGVLKEAGGSFAGSEDNLIYIPLTTAQSRLVSRSIGEECSIDHLRLGHFHRHGGCRHQ